MKYLVPSSLLNIFSSTECLSYLFEVTFDSLEQLLILTALFNGIEDFTGLFVIKMTDILVCYLTAIASGEIEVLFPAHALDLRRTLDFPGNGGLICLLRFVQPFAFFFDDMEYAAHKAIPNNTKKIQYVLGIGRRSF